MSLSLCDLLEMDETNTYFLYTPINGVTMCPFCKFKTDGAYCNNEKCGAVVCNAFMCTKWLKPGKYCDECSKYRCNRCNITIIGPHEKQCYKCIELRMGFNQVLNDIRHFDNNFHISGIIGGRVYYLAKEHFKSSFQ